MLNTPDRAFLGDASDSAEPIETSNAGFIQLVLNNKRRIILAALVGGLLFTAYAKWTIPLYSAQALIATGQPEFGQQVSPLNISHDAQQSVLMSEIDLIQSPAFVGHIVDRFDLVNDPEFSHLPWWENFRTDLNAFGYHVERWLQPVIGKFTPPVSGGTAVTADAARAKRSKTILAVERHLSVGNDGKSVTIYINFSSADPDKAARLANAFAEAYVKETLNSKLEQSAAINTWVDGRLAELRTGVLNAERKLQEARQRLNAGEAGSGGTLADQSLVRWNNELVMAKARRMAAEERFNTAKALLTNPAMPRSTTDVLGSPLIQRLREQEGLLAGQYAAQISKSGPNYPAAVALKHQLDDISQTISRETKKIVDALSNEVETDRATEVAITKALDAAQNHANTVDLGSGTIVDLQQRALSARAIYDQFLRKYNETSGLNYLPQTDVRIISRAMTPDRPSYPKLILFLPAGLILGGFLGFVRSLQLDGSENTFRSSRTLEMVTGLPALGYIPEKPKAHKNTLATLASNAHFDQSVARFNAILERSNHSGKTRIVALTSALPQEGKTTLCVAAARSAALSGKRVLVVEFDRHRPNLQRVFGDDDKSGDFMDLVAGTRTFSEVIRRDRNSDVDYLPIAKRVDDRQRMAKAAELTAVFQKFTDFYDLVLVDTAPILAFSDLASLNDIIEVCLLVVRWGRTPRDAVTAALRQLRMLDLNIGGLVLTGVDPTKTQSDAEGKYINQIMNYYMHKGSE